MSPEELWAFLPWGYLVTILIETPILLVGLSKPHPWKRRLAAGLWLTACTYPMVVLVFPLLINPVTDKLAYILVAETFAPVAECLLFAAAFHADKGLPTSARWRDMAVVTLANLASFGIGELIR